MPSGHRVNRYTTITTLQNENKSEAVVNNGFKLKYLKINNLVNQTNYGACFSLLANNIPKRNMTENVLSILKCLRLRILFFNKIQKYNLEIFKNKINSHLKLNVTKKLENSNFMRNTIVYKPIDYVTDGVIGFRKKLKSDLLHNSVINYFNDRNKNELTNKSHVRWTKEAMKQSYQIDKDGDVRSRSEKQRFIPLFTDNKNRTKRSISTNGRSLIQPLRSKNNDDSSDEKWLPVQLSSNSKEEINLEENSDNLITEDLVSNFVSNSLPDLQNGAESQLIKINSKPLEHYHIVKPTDSAESLDELILEHTQKPDHEHKPWASKPYPSVILVHDVPDKYLPKPPPNYHTHSSHDEYLYPTSEPERYPHPTYQYPRPPPSPEPPPKPFYHYPSSEPSPEPTRPVYHYPSSEPSPEPQKKPFYHYPSSEPSPEPPFPKPTYHYPSPETSPDPSRPIYHYPSAEPPLRPAYHYPSPEPSPEPTRPIYHYPSAEPPSRPAHYYPSSEPSPEPSRPIYHYPSAEPPSRPVNHYPSPPSIKPQSTPIYHFKPTSKPIYHYPRPEPEPEPESDPEPFYPDPEPEPEFHPDTSPEPSPETFDDQQDFPPASSPPGNTPQPPFIIIASPQPVSSSPLNPITITSGRPPPSIVIFSDTITPVSDIPPASDTPINPIAQPPLADEPVPPAEAPPVSPAGSPPVFPGVPSFPPIGPPPVLFNPTTVGSLIGSGGGSGGQEGSGSNGCPTSQDFNSQLITNSAQNKECTDMTINLNDNGGDTSSAGGNVQYDDVPDTSTVVTPTKKPKPSDSMSILEYVSSFFASLTLFNPISISFWSMLFAPVSILLASGLGVAALVLPWAFPRFWFGRNSRSRRKLSRWHREIDLDDFTPRILEPALQFERKLKLGFDFEWFLRQLDNL